MKLTRAKLERKLCEAIRNQDCLKIKWLVEDNDFDVNSRFETCAALCPTLLSYAACHGGAKILWYLISDLGCKVDNLGGHALTCAIEDGCEYTAMCLLSCGATVYAHHIVKAIRNDMTEFVAKFIGMGLHKRTGSFHNITDDDILSMACEHGALSIVKYCVHVLCLSPTLEQYKSVFFSDVDKETKKAILDDMRFVQSNIIIEGLEDLPFELIEDGEFAGLELFLEYNGIHKDYTIKDFLGQNIFHYLAQYKRYMQQCKNKEQYDETIEHVKKCFKLCSYECGESIILRDANENMPIDTAIEYFASELIGDILETMKTYDIYSEEDYFARILEKLSFCTERLVQHNALYENEWDDEN